MLVFLLSLSDVEECKILLAIIIIPYVFKKDDLPINCMH
ncbi:hypothetical protein ECTW14313_0197 [Escherichia coli O157:H7 str. TW14313]|nr:hypothetical protein ECTW14313_0197 [Escherichia coli O157:H7 str. TW14313]